MRMDLRQLRYAEAVAQWASFTRAATELHVAQPALSLSIRRLEVELGVRLFDRTSRRVTVTDAGTAFATGARRIREQLDTLTDEMAQFAGALRGRVRVSVWYHFDPERLTLFREFIALNPGVQFMIEELPGPAMLAALREGDLDFGYPVLTRGLDLREIDYVSVREEPLALAVPLDHPVASMTAVTLRELEAIKLIAPHVGTALRSLIDQIFEGAGIRPKIVVETNEIAAATTYVSIGIGAVVLTRRIIEATGRKVAIVPIADAPPLTLALAWSARRYRGPAAVRALEFARSLVEPAAT
jgi:DNA-binding transcriptional LysR family regulator